MNIPIGIRVVANMKSGRDCEFYQKNCPLLCVITGMEHSGTTLLSQLFNGHPRIASGFECGILLSEIYNFHEIHPFYEWLATGEEDPWGWGITKVDRRRLMGCQTFDEFYWHLNKLKGSATSNMRLREKFQKSDLIFDKTPAYVFRLSSIMRKTNYKYIVTRKTVAEQLLSSKKRAVAAGGAVNREIFSQNYFRAANEISICQKLFPDRLRVVRYNELVQDANRIMENLKEWVGLHDEVNLNLNQYNNEFGKYIIIRNTFSKNELSYIDPSKKLEIEELEWAENYEIEIQEKIPS